MQRFIGEPRRFGRICPMIEYEHKEMFPLQGQLKFRRR
jgi:hypothetical protein